MQITCAENNLPKNMFDCALKLILEFSKIFYVFGIKQKYSCTQLCMNVKNHH
jgi:hypothetical protein